MPRSKLSFKSTVSVACLRVWVTYLYVYSLEYEYIATLSMLFSFTWNSTLIVDDVFKNSYVNTVVWWSSILIT